jgi:hypothetical protein
LQTFQGALGTARVGDALHLDAAHGIAGGMLQHAEYPLQIHCRMPPAGFCALAWFPPGGAPDFKVIPPMFLRPASAVAAQSLPLK